MNDMAEQALTKIYNDPQLREQFMSQNTLESMYGYCSSISGGYTKEEFDVCINEMCEYANRQNVD